MAKVALEIPKVGLVMENARLVRWLKQVGDRVQQGDALLELETEKSVVEIEATEAGRLTEILVNVDQEVQVGDRVAWLETDVPESAAAVAATPQPAARPAMPKSSAAPTAAPQVPTSVAAASPVSAFVAAASAKAVSTPSATPASKPTSAPGSSRIKSSPVARRLAVEHGIDLRSVTGTGPRGRVQLRDIREAIEARSTQAAGGSAQLAARSSAGFASSSPAATGPQTLSPMRRALARSMSLSNATVPQFVVERAIDWSALHQHRSGLLAQLPAGAARPSVNDFLLQALARTLLSFPALNATFSGDVSSPDAAIVPAMGAHIGLVVAVEGGLLVPVLHNVEQLGLEAIARRRSEVVERALQGKLRREELQGATLSLSNLGARGPDRFTAMINPPESAILAVGRQRECVVVLNGGVHIRPLSQLSLTVDHRVSDGRLAADFLAYLVELLEGDAWRA